jgi:molybdopterin-dependent oxidoreductase alpha subunit
MAYEETRKVDLTPYAGPAGGQGSLKSVAEILTREHSLLTSGTLMMRQNKTHGFMCVSCAWAKPGKPHLFEYCENGAKATAWELTTKTVPDDLFAKHTVSELRAWPDYNLEEVGRLTRPMRYDSASDRYVPCDWDEAFRAIGTELQAMDPEKVVLYSSGRTSLEASYMYALFGRLYGTNNFPDSSNMCHESTSVALPESIGVPVGTVALDDFDHTDCIFFFGQNVGSNAPRMLHQLQDARSRGAEIITFNPLLERGLERFANPQSPIELIQNKGTVISTQYHQVRAGGDISAMFGICKVVIAAHDTAKKAGTQSPLDEAFLAEHTSDFEAFAQAARGYSWPRWRRPRRPTCGPRQRSASTAWA